MGTRKFVSEFSLHMQASYLALLQQDDFDLADAKSAFDEHGFHIYLICRRPRITIDPDQFASSSSVIEGCFRIQNQNTYESVPFRLENGTGYDSLRLETAYPYNRFAFVSTTDGNQPVSGKVATLALRVGIPERFRRLDVLYVGQSYGTRGSRTAPDRLKSHSTLQGIYSAASNEFPDHDIWLLLLEFEEILITSFDGTQKRYGTTMTEDAAHIEQVLRQPVSEQQRINFAEAALIRYFDAPYNVTYRETFPSPAHGSYAACYEIEYNSVSVDISTEPIRSQLYSAAVSAKWEHFATFPLHSKAERQSMFAILGA